MLLEIARSILAQPTAPFHEDAVRAEILMQLAQCPHVTAVQDDFGNVIACYRRGPGVARYAFAAHMDHPAYVGGEFLGGVPVEYREKNPPVRDFGAFAMWDLPAFELRDGRIFSRACDDLIGCAAIVALFHELERAGSEACVHGLFTRAEEVGFVGAIRLAQSGCVSKELTVVSLETSSEKGGPAKMGDGVIVRVGDRTSIFDDAATAALLDAAKRAEIPVQRCLMSGGTCEATAYQLYGYRSAGLCVALGNYHNCGPNTEIASEFVSAADVVGMVRLMFAATTTAPTDDPHAALRIKLEAGVASYARFTDPLA
ncbi:MAG: M20/M25/M40 family metallo-hydrolase [Chthoniobacter sp.]|nr:M20/M25/M40 family metallo-hydrolase [Chthoniobacter sp.]